MQRDVEALARSADDLSRRTGEQVAGLESAASSLNGLTEAARDAFNEARRVGSVVGVTKDEAEQGDLIVRQAAKSMEQIATLAQQINQVVGVMDEIAFQTNILAINAGVEAARSGESGRGFAIVAQEVRALAQRSASAAKDIRALITASTREVGSGVNLVGQTSQALAKVLRQVAEIDGVVAALATAAETQVGGLAETGGAVGRVEQSAQLGAAALSQSTAAAQALREGVAELAGWMAALRLSPPAPARPSLRPGAAARTRPAPVIQLNEARGGVQRRPWPPLGRGGRSEGDDR
jgi:methyl-accepting chemotaxis protein